MKASKIAILKEFALLINKNKGMSPTQANIPQPTKGRVVANTKPVTIAKINLLIVVFKK